MLHISLYQLYLRTFFLEIEGVPENKGMQREKTIFSLYNIQARLLKGGPKKKPKQGSNRERNR